jgi:hypothetical protein
VTKKNLKENKNYSEISCVEFNSNYFKCGEEINVFRKKKSSSIIGRQEDEESKKSCG